MIRYYLNLTTFRQGNLNCSAGWKIFNPVWHGITKQEKCSSLELPRPFCASKWVATNYFRKITSNYFQNNHSKSNWSWWISKPHFRNTAFVPPRRAVQGAIFVRLNELGRVSKQPDWSQFSPPKKFGNFEKKSANKIWYNKFKRIKMPCPMPERVKWQIKISIIPYSREF